jgi:hypothetical protein
MVAQPDHRERHERFGVAVQGPSALHGFTTAAATVPRIERTRPETGR